MSTSAHATIEAEDRAERAANRTALLLILVVLAVAAYSVAFGLQTLMWLQAKHWTTISPWLADIPPSLPPAATPGKGTQIKSFDYQFNVPWARVAKETPGPVATTFRFQAGQVVIFYDPETQMDTLRSMRNASPIEYQKFANVFADHPVESNYALYQAVYDASPAQLSPFLRLRDALRINSLLLWKLSFGFDFEPRPGEPGIFSIDLGKNHGFQFGDPAKGRPVGVRVFDDRNHQFRFIFAVTGESKAGFTQDDINMVVQSLEPIPILER
jgi:hypothetical protein